MVRHTERNSDFIRDTFNLKVVYLVALRDAFSKIQKHKPSRRVRSTQ